MSAGERPVASDPDAQSHGPDHPGVAAAGRSPRRCEKRTR